MSSMYAFEAAKEQLERFFPYVPSTRALHGLVDKLGPIAEKVLKEAPCPTGDVIIVQLDGRGLPKIRAEEYKKRCQGHKIRRRGKAEAAKKRQQISRFEAQGGPKQVEEKRGDSRHHLRAQSHR